MSEAGVMFDYSLHAAAIQSDAARGYLLEHPSTASSWSRDSVSSFLAKHSQDTFPPRLVTFDQCRFGLMNPSGTQPMKKRTVFLTNVPGIISRFDNMTCRCEVPHFPIQGTDAGVQVSRHSQIYPNGLVNAVCQGVQEFCKAR